MPSAAVARSMGSISRATAAWKVRRGGRASPVVRRGGHAPATLPRAAAYASRSASVSRYGGRPRPPGRPATNHRHTVRSPTPRGTSRVADLLHRQLTGSTLREQMCNQKPPGFKLQAGTTGRGRQRPGACLVRRAVLHVASSVRISAACPLRRSVTNQTKTALCTISTGAAL